MFTDDTRPPIVVVVGSYGVGKSSFVRALGGKQTFHTADKSGETSKNPNDKNNNNNSKTPAGNEAPTSDGGGAAAAGAGGHKPSNSQNLDGFDLESESDRADSELIVPPFSITIDNETIMIVDTAARDVINVQQQMSEADLVLVVINGSHTKSIEELDEYWIDQFSENSLQVPVIAVFNKIDKLSPQQLSQLQKKFSKPTREHFVLETIVYVSAYTGDGIREVQQTCIDTLHDVSECPRWQLIDPYSWKLQSSFESSLHRIFRLLDRDGDSVLNYNELESFNRKILDEDFTPDEYNFFLRRLNEQNDSYVTTEGLTFYGFRHLMHRFAIAKKWNRCWDVLRHFHYQNDLTLHPRVFPQLPPRDADQTIELDSCVFRLLERLFRQFADDTISDDDTRSVASSMISHTHTIAQFQANNRRGGPPQYGQFGSMQMQGGGAGFDDYDPARVLTMDGIRELLSVLPKNVPHLHCTLLDENVLDHFESAGRKLNRLTENGWLSFWAMYAVESPEFCFEQLTYLDLSTDADRSSWFKLTNSKRNDHSREQIDRTVVRALLFGGPGCGKTVFCDRLLCRIPLRNAQFSHKRTTHFRAVSNRIGSSDEYFFLAITEVPAIKEFIEEAMDRYLPAYDMILLMFDKSQSRSFYELNKIFDRMPRNHRLPIQVIASKADLTHVTQYNQDENDEKYNVLECLENWGLAPYGETWLTNKESSDFPSLFDDLFFIATNPHYRRLKQPAKDDKMSWNTLVKRTITITVSMGVVVIVGVKLYQIWKGSSWNNAKKIILK